MTMTALDLEPTRLLQFLLCLALLCTVLVAISIRALLPKEAKYGVTMAAGLLAVLLFQEGIILLSDLRGVPVPPHLYYVISAPVAVSLALSLMFHLRPALREFHDIYQAAFYATSVRADLERHRRSFMESIVGILHLDEEGNIIEANRMFAGYLETTPEELQGEHFTSFVHADDVKEATSLFDRLKFGEASNAATFPHFNRWVSRRGSIINLCLQSGVGRPYKDEAHVCFAVTIVPVPGQA